MFANWTITLIISYNQNYVWFFSKGQGTQTIDDEQTTKYDEKLFYTQKIVPNIEVFLYELNFSLKEYKK